MKLDEYIKHLTELYNTYGNLEMIYGKDDEGNEYQMISYLPSVGRYDLYEFDAIDAEDLKIDPELIFDINAVCVN